MYSQYIALMSYASNVPHNVMLAFVSPYASCKGGCHVMPLGGHVGKGPCRWMVCARARKGVPRCDFRAQVSRRLFS